MLRFLIKDLIEFLKEQKDWLINIWT